MPNAIWRDELRYTNETSPEDLNRTFVVNPYHTDVFFPPFNPYKDLVINPIWRHIAASTKPRRISLNQSVNVRGVGCP